MLRNSAANFFLKLENLPVQWPIGNFVNDLDQTPDCADRGRYSRYGCYQQERGLVSRCNYMQLVFRMQRSTSPRPSIIGKPIARVFRVRCQTRVLGDEIEVVEK